MLSRSLLLAATALVIALGMVFGAALWILAGVVVLATVGISYAMANQMADAATITRMGGDIEVKVGSKIPVTIRIENKSRWPLPWVLVEDISPKFATQSSDTFSSSVQFDGQRLGVFLIPGGKHRELNYTVDCRRRGYLQIGPTMVETGDLLGMFRRFKVTGRPTYVTVLPAVYPISDYAIGSRRPIGEIRLRERSMEDPTRIRGIRQWQIGDPMRGIHWAATARTGVLHSKVYEPSSIIGSTLVLDMNSASNPAQHEPLRCDLAISAAASIAYYLMQSNEPFGLVTNGRDAADRLQTPRPKSSLQSVEPETAGSPKLRPKAYRRRGQAAKSDAMSTENDRIEPVIIKNDKTPIHYQQMLSTLARLERGDTLSLPELLTECESQIASDTTALIIVQIADEAALAAIISLARRGRAVEVIANVHSTEEHSRIAAPLSDANITTHHLRDSDSIAGLCRAVSIR